MNTISDRTDFDGHRSAPDIAEAGYQATMAMMEEITSGLKARGFK